MASRFMHIVPDPDTRLRGLSVWPAEIRMNDPRVQAWFGASVERRPSFRTRSGIEWRQDCWHLAEVLRQRCEKDLNDG